MPRLLLKALMGLKEWRGWGFESSQKHMNEESHFLWLFSCTNVDNGTFLSEATVLVAKHLNWYIS